MGTILDRYFIPFGAFQSDINCLGDENISTFSQPKDMGGKVYGKDIRDSAKLVCILASGNNWRICLMEAV